jgi:hypothetical protein
MRKLKGTPLCGSSGVSHFTKENDDMKKCHTYIKAMQCDRRELPASLEMFEDVWEAHVLNEQPSSPLDIKSKNFAVFYYRQDTRDRNISRASKAYGIDRETATRLLARCEKLGWLNIGDSPIQAREKTLPRVYSRRVFWTKDYWNDAYALPVRTGDASLPQDPLERQVA